LASETKGDELMILEVGGKKGRREVKQQNQKRKNQVLGNLQKKMVLGNGCLK